MKKKLLAIFTTCAALLATPFLELKISPDSVQKTAPVPAAGSEFPENPVPEPAAELQTLESSVGILTYYSQTDEKWKDAIYGGNDNIAGYGCGPTVLAMLVTSFTNNDVTPADMAAWAASNGYWISGSGSKHSLIPEGASSFGLQAEPFQAYDAQSVTDNIKSAILLT